MRILFWIVVSIVTLTNTGLSQSADTPRFRSVVESRLKQYYRAELMKICPIDTDVVADRIFRDYGAIFVSNNGGQLPSRCIFDSEEDVQLFQRLMTPDVEYIGGTPVTLQKAAMSAFKAARAEASKRRLTISPRGGASASTRSYGTTTDLWRSRFIPGLKYWTSKGRIRKQDAVTAQRAPIRQQVAMVLAWEREGLYFSTDMSKSILYSVAAPGASQHIFMLALDVEQFGNKQVRQILAKHGWFQTVKSDLPHFTYIGVSESELPSLGLRSEVVGGQTFWIPDM